ncbi:MAG: hypothetical protein ABGZ24_02965 [Fuerstiella sp.]
MSHVGLQKPLVVTFTIGVLLTFVLLVQGRPAPDENSRADGNELADADSVFAKPRRQQLVDQIRREVTALFRQKQFAAAELRCAALVQLVPEDPTGHYNLACALARQDRPDAAMTSLRTSVAKGLRSPRHLNEDSDFESLRLRDDWQKLINAAEKPFEPELKPATISPREIDGGMAMVAESNAAWDPRSRRLLTFFRDERKHADAGEIATGSDQASTLLRRWHEQQSAAGHVGVLYDNHDNDHSVLDRKLYPQLARTRYSPAARQHKVHNGLQCLLHFNGIVLGNSSTAIVSGPFWRSQPRLAYCDSQSTAILATQYFGNHVYFYPEHRDYDPGTNGASGYGDVYPANTPYLVISQGSSGTDRVFMDAFAATLAAFRTDVRSMLERKAALMPCLQMIFRSCNRQVRASADYLTGIAHPPVFSGDQVNKLKMVKMAHDLRPESLPPVAILEVIEEDQFQVGTDYFEAGPREKLFTTPAAIARVCRSVQQTYHMTVSAQKSFDLNQQPLNWRWVVLQGDPALVDMQPQDEKSSVVSISVKHHERQPIRPDSKMESSRVDIGVFANNGTHFSAPAIISFWWPTNDTRQYSPDGRILAVEYRTQADGGAYADPMLVTGRNWTDRYQYDGSNRLIGWDRVRGERTEHFSRHGYLVTGTDSLGRPLQAVEIGYAVKTRKDAAPTLVQQTGERRFTYVYGSQDDLVGTVTVD